MSQMSQKDKMRKSQHTNLKEDQKNKIRKVIKSIFVKWNCFVLSRPVTEEKLLWNLDKVEYSQVEDSFKMELNKLVTYVYSSLEVKWVKNVALNGSSFVSYLSLIVEGIAKKRIPAIDSLVTRIFNSINENILSGLNRDLEKLDMISLTFKQHKKELK